MLSGSGPPGGWRRTALSDLVAGYFAGFMRSRSRLICSRVGGCPGVRISPLGVDRSHHGDETVGDAGDGVPSEVGIVELGSKALGDGRTDSIGTFEVVGEPGIENSADGIRSDRRRLRSIAAIRLNHD